MHPEVVPFHFGFKSFIHFQISGTGYNRFVRGMKPDACKKWFSGFNRFANEWDYPVHNDPAVISFEIVGLFLSVVHINRTIPVFAGFAPPAPEIARCYGRIPEWYSRPCGERFIKTMLPGWRIESPVAYILWLNPAQVPFPEESCGITIFFADFG